MYHYDLFIADKIIFIRLFFCLCFFKKKKKHLREIAWFLPNGKNSKIKTIGNLLHI